jgi:hypothetical protein
MCISESAGKFAVIPSDLTPPTRRVKGDPLALVLALHACWTVLLFCLETSPSSAGTRIECSGNEH